MQKLGKGCGVRTDSVQWEGGPGEWLLTRRRLVLAEEEFSRDHGRKTKWYELP